MLKRFLNIAIIFTLLISFTGITTVKGSCGMAIAAFSSETKNCCEKDIPCECEVNIEYSNLDVDLDNFNTKISISDITLLPVIEFFFNTLTLEGSDKKFLSYKPPVLLVDIPVRVQCFRL